MRPTDEARLGRTSITITRLGLGTATLGSIPADDDGAVARAIVRRAVDAGLRLIDTAPAYDRGASERRLGSVLPELDRDRYVLSTKAGVLLRPLPFRTKVVKVVRRGVTSGPSGFAHIASQVDAVIRRTNRTSPTAATALSPTPARTGPRLSEIVDTSYDGVMRSVEESLARLATDRIDILLLHEPRRPMATVMAGAYRALDRLRADGTVGAIGIGDKDVAAMIRYLEAGDFDCVLVGYRYTLLDQTAADALLPLAAARDIGVIVGGVFHSGMLADPRPGALSDGYRPASAEAIRRALRLQEICARYDVPLKAVALQFPTRHAAVAGVVVGVASVAELEEDMALSELPIPAELWQAILDEVRLEPAA